MTKANESLWSPSQQSMITRGLDVRRYASSPRVDKFPPRHIADISFPKGYNKGNRVYSVCPTLNTTTAEESFIYKEENEVENAKSLQNGPITGAPVKANEVEKLILNALKNRSNASPSEILASVDKLPIDMDWEAQEGQIFGKRYVIRHERGRWRLFKLGIRKLTEGEAYRLMGFENEAYKRCVMAGQAASTIFHQAGDSIVVAVLMGIFGEMANVDYKSKIEELSDRLAREKDIPFEERMKDPNGPNPKCEDSGLV